MNTDAEYAISYIEMEQVADEFDLYNSQYAAMLSSFHIDVPLISRATWRHGD